MIFNIMNKFDNNTSLKVFSLSEIINLKFPPKDYILEPFLPEQGMAMVYSPTGVGKDLVVFEYCDDGCWEGSTGGS